MHSRRLKLLQITFFIFFFISRLFLIVHYSSALLVFLIALQFMRVDLNKFDKFEPCLIIIFFTNENIQNIGNEDIWNFKY